MGPYGAAAIPIVVVVVVIDVLLVVVSLLLASFAMERVIAGPGLSSMSPESKRNMQNNVLRVILSSRGLFFEFPVFSTDRTAQMPRLGRFLEVSRCR